MTSTISKLEAWFGRRSACLTHPRAARRAALLAPLLFGLVSLLLGQDDGWDMRNYHLYNPYAWFNDSLAVDISPAGFQSYFNPLVDVPYYVLTALLPGPLVGFLFGALHGLNFVLLLAIARLLLPPGAVRPALLLALAGALGAGFLAELGNSMGDNLTSLLVLASLHLLLRRWPSLLRWGAGAALTLGLAGLAMGLGVGLKLTNAGFAAALCLALFAVPLPFWQRLRLAFGFGLAVLAGMAASTGFWFYKMWTLFGNPLFPQFNNIFRSPLAWVVGVIDLGHLPKSAAEALLWPFVFSADMARVAEVPLRQWIWPLAYCVLAAWLLLALWRRAAPAGRAAPAAATPLDARGRFTLLFFVLSYLIWMGLFSIYRYLVPIELLAPLLVWLLLHAMLGAATARRLGGAALLACALYTLPFVTWGHAGWATRSFRADAPALAKPQDTVVFLTMPTLAWLRQFFPPQTAFIAIGNGFPESPAYLERLQAAVARRAGPHYLLLPVARNGRQAGVERKLDLARRLGLTASPADCARLQHMLGKVRFQVDVRHLPAAADGQWCTLELQAQYRIDLAASDRALDASMLDQLHRYGLDFAAPGCRSYPAFVGAEPYPYRLCQVRALAR
ncbi:glycosyltransferase 87 family protein [Rugamonas sp. DEMB1]|uniref:glycosyltransferase 87 family protein n=1 Tax=Rugamonas sp. DEMB1 TaxID=3039386 RepID=UPI00244BE93D|nr:glycosyltransferase 87 family protein [Rugamonas sp. DEMB1]WGG49863.1 glycosyltransferase 87 family protein [Rugamonas sp. DEMB1]